MKILVLSLMSSDFLLQLLKFSYILIFIYVILLFYVKLAS